MDSLDIIDCLSLAANGDNAAKEVFHDYINGIRKSGFTDTSQIALGINETINKCAKERAHSEAEKVHALFYAGVLYGGFTPNI